MASLRARVAAVDKQVQGQPRPKVLFVVWYRPLITAGSQTFISNVIQRAGGVSISDDLKSEWPHMGLEEVLNRAPDVILFPQTDAFAPGLDEFQKLPGWRDLAAVKNHRLYFVAETIMRPSPRLIDALEELAFWKASSCIPHGRNARRMQVSSHDPFSHSQKCSAPAAGVGRGAHPD